MKAIALISGGLDSILAARFMQELGTEIIPLNFRMPFYQGRQGQEDRTAAFVRKALNQELRTEDISREFLDLVQNPKHGFGSNINPCIDCKILMLRKAGQMMTGWGVSFLVTGEVLGQRPMSQNRRTLSLIAQESGWPGLILRPLSAKLLDETEPEKQGWVSRDQLLDFNGRTRRPQMELAQRFGIEDYPNPAGGCLLTDPEFSRRLRDLVQRGALNLENIELLKIGRHFQVGPDTRFVVGRNQLENNRLEQLAGGDDGLFMPEDAAGPTGLVRGPWESSLAELCAKIICRYADRENRLTIPVVYRRLPGQQGHALEAPPLEQSLLERLRL